MVRYRTRVWEAVLLLAGLLNGCTVFGPRPVAHTATPPAVTPTLPATPTAAPIRQEQTQIPTPNRHNEYGPWLLVAGQEGLIAYNPDGSGKTMFAVGNLLAGASDLRSGRIPRGDWLALRTVQDITTLSGMELILLHLPNGEVHHVAPLLATKIDQALGTQYSVRDAAAAGGALLWSPDGRYLAFVAALDGPTADVYLLDPQTSSLRRLNAGPYQAYPLAWTPDGSRVIYAEVKGCVENGCRTDSVWIAPANMGAAHKLYPAKDSHGETVLGFWSPTQMIVAGADAAGRYNIRRVDLNTGEEFSLYIGHFANAAFDPASLTAAWTVPGDLLLYDTYTGLEGLDAISAGSSSYQFVKRGDWRRVVWLPETGWFALGSGQNDGALMWSPDEKTVAYPLENWWIHPPRPSPDGKLVAFYGDGGIMKETSGLRLYDAAGRPLQTVTTSPVEALAWGLDSKGIFYISENALFYQVVGEKQPVKIDAHVILGEGGAMVWFNSRP